MNISQLKTILKNKKGMEYQQLYSFVLLLILVGAIIGVGMITLSSFAYQINNTDSEVAGIVNSTGTKIGAIGITWLPLIVVISVLAIILTLVISSFGGAVGRK